MSGEFTIKEQVSVDGTDAFALPPAAMSPSKLPNAASRRSSKTDSAYLPASPTSPEFGPGRTASSTRQAGVKRSLEDFELPPPPTRTRKIIQMKPKTQNSPKPAPASSKSSTKESNKNAPNNANIATPAASKKKQPSATSAAGRKIARKTAHSLIERRRRSKMNEEFGTLKDMIPACKGQDMHKLSILQASIEYVNYLEQCIQDLKMAGGQQSPMLQHMPPGPPSPTSPEALPEFTGSTYSASVSPDLYPISNQMNETSPVFSPQGHVPSAGIPSEVAPSVLPSPALGPMQSSPSIEPQYRNPSSADVDHEASAALLMLNRDCRQATSLADGERSGSISGPPEGQEYSHPDNQRRMGMSVKELLIS
ncbi:putative HLH transcription factor [Aspergillus steynii IBT 23096]|uniref:Putative HLH transcription factor n=1 Tax=Aspergillus steynii IBT 23096 TaxID=1392250 RepID=A0A2I2FSW9_9EURO|nr:putative HLH transcription factor [Aspergillus steynii IBT 23096]PLB43706.1 putative HLH transcription factor [Aspergillus steynii IBT 23096]